MAGVKLDVFFPGFPTLKHIRHSARLHKAGVRVFEQSSRGENMLLALEPQVHLPLLKLQAWCWAPNSGENSEFGLNFRPKIGANRQNRSKLEQF